MDTPLTKLAAVAVRHISEEPNEMTRAAMLDEASAIFSLGGDELRAEQLSATAAIIRESANAQLQLKSLFA